MWYLGGKKRQSREIVRWARGLAPNFERYCEPFCGAMWSATAMIAAFPDRQYFLSDAHPALVRMWQAGKDGWDPPATVSETDYRWYNERRPVDDPMTGYVGFAWSFGGKYFGGLARGSDGKAKGSYASTVKKIRTLRSASNCIIGCNPFTESLADIADLVYLDPPYAGRTQRSAAEHFDDTEYVRFAVGLASDEQRIVLATDFVERRNWAILHDYGDTVVRHHSSKGADGTRELLMLVG